MTNEELLCDLASRINTAHAESERAALSSLEHARQAGEWLLEAKRQVGHGGWLKWLKANVRFSKSTACNYMSIAENWSKFPTVGNMGIRDALRLLADGEDEQAEPDQDQEPAEAEPKPPTPKPFDIVQELTVIQNWIAARRAMWPETVRQRFFTILHEQLEGLAAEIIASERQGFNEAV